MKISGLHTTLIAGTLLLGAILAADASAQTCGDADGNGVVTVTDGVQTLRGAAGLSSACSEHAASCDVDGSGSTTVSDGVNVLRKAAGITIDERCPGGGDDVADVAQVTDALLPFLVLGLEEVPTVDLSAASALRPAATEDCEDGGSRTTTQEGLGVRVAFAGCRVSEPGLGNFQLDGRIDVAVGFLTAAVTFELRITDLANQRLVAFDGTVDAQARSGGGFFVDDDQLSVRGSEEGPEIFRVTLDDVTVDGDGRLLSGSAEAEDTSDSFALATAEIEVEDGSATASVHVVRDDGSEHDYELDLATGELTPVG
ncbi:MAG: hypothetical protein IT294_11050 [Deltaproteobacteria bacterium]|nr:hypothetical protein [Deltaproteobacteria bacterium]